MKLLFIILFAVAVNSYTGEVKSALAIRPPNHFTGYFITCNETTTVFAIIPNCVLTDTYSTTLWELVITLPPSSGTPTVIGATVNAGIPLGQVLFAGGYVGLRVGQNESDAVVIGGAYNANVGIGINIAVSITYV